MSILKIAPGTTGPRTSISPSTPGARGYSSVVGGQSDGGGLDDPPADPGSGYMWADDWSGYSDVYELARVTAGNPCGDGKPIHAYPKTTINLNNECDAFAEASYVLNGSGSGYEGVGRSFTATYVSGEGSYSVNLLSPWNPTYYFGTAGMTGLG